MLLALQTTVSNLPVKKGVFFQKRPNKYPKFLCIRNSKSSNCFKNKVTHNPTQGFSVLSSDIPWERGSIWSIMAMYMFNLHIPLGIGGLSIVAYLLHQPHLHPQTEVLSLLVLQILELTGVLILLKTTAKPEHKLSTFFINFELHKSRNWVLASALGFGSLTLLVFLTSFLADAQNVSQDVNNHHTLREILLSGNISKTACVVVYCFMAPLLEEMVYRGFLLSSLASTMKWQKAVLMSSIAFSAAHFSSENFVQLFIVGCVVGCCYCWTGNLSSSIVVHSLYNAMILISASMP